MLYFKVPSVALHRFLILYVSVAEFFDTQPPHSAHHSSGPEQKPQVAPGVKSNPLDIISKLLDALPKPSPRWLFIPLAVSAVCTGSATPLHPNDQLCAWPQVCYSSRCSRQRLSMPISSSVKWNR